MKQEEITAVAFTVALVFNGIWSLYVGYPAVLDKHVKKGQSWVYIPVRWKGFYKGFVLIFGKLLAATSIVIGIMALWLYLYPHSLLYFALSVPFLCLMVIFINKAFLHFRYNQQKNTYFSIRDELCRNMEFQRKGLSRVEFDALASFKHQHRLREAEDSGKLTSAYKMPHTLSKKKSESSLGV